MTNPLGGPPGVDSYERNLGPLSPVARQEWEQFLKRRQELINAFLTSAQGAASSLGVPTDTGLQPIGPAQSTSMIDAQQDESRRDLLARAEHWLIPNATSMSNQQLQQALAAKRAEQRPAPQTTVGTVAKAFGGAAEEGVSEAARLTGNILQNVVAEAPFIGETLGKILQIDKAKNWLYNWSSKLDESAQMIVGQQPVQDRTAAQFLTSAGKTAGYVLPMMAAWEGIGAAGAGLQLPGWLARASTPLTRLAARGALTSAVLDDPLASPGDKAVNMGLGAVLGASQIWGRLGIAAGGAAIGAGVGGGVGDTPEERSRNQWIGGIGGAALGALAPMAAAALTKTADGFPSPLGEKIQYANSRISQKLLTEGPDYTVELDPPRARSANPPPEPPRPGTPSGVVNTAEDLTALFRSEPTKSIGGDGQVQTGALEQPRRGLLPATTEVPDATLYQDQAYQAYRAIAGVPGTDIAQIQPESFRQINRRGDLALFEAQRNAPPEAKGLVPVSIGQTHLLGSKVSAADGSPLRVYHGTGVDFEAFDPQAPDVNALFGPGYYHTESPEIAGGYAGQPKVDTGANDWEPERYPNVRPAYLDIKNPFNVDKQWTDEDVTALVNKLEAAYPGYDWNQAREALASHPDFDAFGDVPMTPENGESIYNTLSQTDAGRSQGPVSTDIPAYLPNTFLGKAGLNEALQAVGYDGITHIGGARTGNAPHRVWIAFRPEQVHPPWQIDRLAHGEAIATGESLTKQATVMESATLPDAMGKPQVTDADVVTAMKSTNPGGVSILRNVGRPLEALLEHPDITFVEREGNLDAFVGEVTGDMIRQYEQWGVFETQIVTTRNGHEGTVMSINSKGMVILKRNGGGPFMKSKAENLYPSRYGAPVRMAPDLWDGFQADLLRYMNDQASKLGMQPVEDLFDTRVGDVLQHHMEDYLDRRGINDPADRQAIDAYMNQRYVEAAKDLDPEMRDLQSKVVDAAVAAENAAAETAIVSTEELAIPKGFVWLKDPGTPNGMLRDTLNPESGLEIPMRESDVPAFLKTVDRAAPDLTPTSTIPADVMENVPTDTTLEPRATLEDTADVARPGDWDRLDGDVVSYLRTGEGKVGVGFDKSLVHKLGANMYKGDVGVVAVKEGIQNAVDAIRSAGSGKIDLHFNYKTRTLSIEDDGIGMSPELIETAFVDIGGSGKDALESSGGYGLAKVALFGRSKMIDVKSTTTDAQGDFVTTTLKGSGEDWVSGNMQFETKPATPGESRGTSVKLQFDKNVPLSDYMAQRFLADFQSYSRLPHVDLSAKITTEYGHVDTYNLEDYAPLKPDPVGEFDVPGAKINVYETQARAGSTLQIPVLNRGVFQFSITKYPQNTEGMPKALVIDVNPTVGIEDPSYPFTTSREELKKAAADVLDKVVKNATTMAGQREIQNIVREISNAPTLKGQPNYRVIADTPNFSMSTKQRVANFEPLSRVAQVADRMMRAISEGSWTVPLSVNTRPEFGGIGVAKGWLGLNVRLSGLEDMARAAGAKVTYNEATPNKIYWNPFTTMEEIGPRLDRLGAGYTVQQLAARIAEQLWGTMVHEVAHQMSRGHSTEFAGAHTRLAGDVSRIADRWISEAEIAIEKMLVHEGPQGNYEDLHDEVKNEWSRSGDERTLGKVSDDQSIGATGGSVPGGGDETRRLLERLEARGRELEGIPSERGAALRAGEGTSGMEGAGTGGGEPPRFGPGTGTGGTFDPMNPQLLGGMETLGDQFARLKKSDLPKYLELDRKYQNVLFRYTRYIMAGLEKNLTAAGVDMGRSWKHYEAIETARIKSDNEAYPWLNEYGDIMREFDAPILRDGTVTKIHEIEDISSRMAEFAKLKDRGYSIDEIEGFVEADNKLTDFNHRWFQFLTEDPAFSLTADREIFRYMSHVRARQAENAPDPYDSKGWLSPNVQYFAEFAREGNLQFRVMDARELGNYMIRAGMFKKYQAAPWEDFVKTWSDPRIPDSIQKLMLDHARAMRYGYDARGDYAVQGVQAAMEKMLNLKLTAREAQQILAAPVSGMYMSMLAGRASIFFRDAIQPLMALAKVRVPYMLGVYKDVLNPANRAPLRAMYERGLKGGWILHEAPATEGLAVFEEPGGLRQNELLGLSEDEQHRRDQMAHLRDVLNELPAWLSRPTESNLSTLKWYGKQQQLHRAIVGEASYRQADAALLEYRHREMLAALSKDPDYAIPYRQFAKKSFFSSFEPAIANRLHELVDGGQDEEAKMLFAREVANWSQHKFGRREQPAIVRSNFGRILSVFSNFSGQYAESLVSGFGNGEPSHRARFGMTQAAVTAALLYAGAKTGWSFGKWVWAKALGYTGGPGVDYLARLTTAAVGAAAQADDRRPSPFQKEAMRAVINDGLLPNPMTFFPYSGYLRSAAEYSAAAQGTNPTEQALRYTITGDRGSKIDMQRQSQQRADELQQLIEQRAREMQTAPVPSGPPILRNPAYRPGKPGHPGGGAIQ